MLPSRGGSRGSSFGGDRGGSRFSGGSGGHRRERRQETFDVVCDKCGEDCKVPFKPMNSKPIFCDKCYSKDGGGSSSVDHTKDFSAVNERLVQLENKVDQVLTLLGN